MISWRVYEGEKTGITISSYRRGLAMGNGIDLLRSTNNQGCPHKPPLEHARKTIEFAEYEGNRRKIEL